MLFESYYTYQLDEPSYGYGKYPARLLYKMSRVFADEFYRQKRHSLPAKFPSDAYSYAMASSSPERGIGPTSSVTFVAAL